MSDLLDEQKGLGGSADFEKLYIECRKLPLAGKGLAAKAKTENSNGDHCYKESGLLEHITSRPKVKLIYRTGCVAGLTSKPHEALQCIKIKSLKGSTDSQEYFMLLVQIHPRPLTASSSNSCLAASR